MSDELASVRMVLDVSINWNETRRLCVAAALTVLAFAGGAALLAVAGWFIASSAIAGLAVTTSFSFVFPSAAIRALAVVRTLGRYGERVTSHSVTLDLVARLRTALFSRALRLPQDRVASLRSAELLGRITDDTDAVDQTLLRVALPVGLLVVTVVGTVSCFLLVSVPLASWVGAGLMGTAGALVVAGRRQVREQSSRLVVARARARSVTLELIDGIPELVSFGIERQAAADASQHLGELAQARRQLALITARGQAAGGVLADLTLVGVVTLGAGLLSGTAESPAIFVTVALVTIVVFEPVASVPAAVAGLARARWAAQQLLTVFPLTAEPVRPARLPSVRGSVARGIELRAQICGLSGASGGTVVLTGRSGSGKSRLLRSIAAEVGQPANIAVGGVDPWIDHALMPAKVTLVAQDAHVFDATIRENLLLANADATDAELWAALAGAALGDC